MSGTKFGGLTRTLCYAVDSSDLDNKTWDKRLNIHSGISGAFADGVGVYVSVGGGEGVKVSVGSRDGVSVLVAVGDGDGVGVFVSGST